MGKRAKAPQSGMLPSRELYQRMNFLLQSSQFAASLGARLGARGSSSKAPTAGEDPAAGEAPTAEAAAPAVSAAGHGDNGGERGALLLPAARFYAREMRQIARKAVLRLSPHVKRGICGACSTPLLPGVSCAVRVKGRNRGRRVITTCTYCGAQSRIVMANPDHQLFVDKPEHGTIH
ncbi:Ribonuclease P protein subunit p21 [Coemansia javaensis]|uniref:Ribonuclease P protein subunit p21 n=1 Tax=Coemansia javaensis TaxID=2761396 RepID=A0A9W8H9L8_9FUNG|nr:Ribonuclease P protein subunit p21 [Coemansia javaensis]